VTLLAFLDEAALPADVAPGSAVALLGAEARHANVRRTRVGEHVLVTGADGLQAVVAVTAVSRDRVDGEVVSLTRSPEPARPLVLVQGLAQSGRDLQAVESAVELGVDRVVPWQAERCVVRWSGDKRAKGAAKWTATVREAVKQSRRPRVPVVTEATTSGDLAAAVREAVAAGAAVLVLHETAAGSFRTALAAADEGPVWVVVGPEGGITQGEVSALVAAGGTAVRLGPEVLRSSSAGPAALAAIAAHVGRWD
jgi:16S rRNA (uracil1498-N3)-methyltransferase